jgi:excisionase family DNA binding protein
MEGPVRDSGKDGRRRETPGPVAGLAKVTHTRDPGLETRPIASPVIITVDELAALLRVNRKTVYDALARGDIPGARRIGATYRIHRDAVLDWLASSQDRAARSRRNR